MLDGAPNRPATCDVTGTSGHCLPVTEQGGHMSTFEINRRTAVRGVAASALAGGVLVTAGQGAGAVTAGESAASARPSTLKQGDRGWWVQNVQRRLLDANYWLRSADGVYGFGTAQAVMALQKVHGLDRDGVVGPQTWKAIYAPRTPKPRTASSWEIDKSRQIMMSARYGWSQWVFNTSTGSGKRYWSSASGRYEYATTPSGSFRIFRGVNGEDKAPLGVLWRPRYFNGGIAVHGFDYVPGYPDSHGCCRVSDEGMNYIWWKNLLPIGRVVRVY